MGHIADAAWRWIPSQLHGAVRCCAAAVRYGFGPLVPRTLFGTRGARPVALYITLAARVSIPPQLRIATHAAAARFRGVGGQQFSRRNTASRPGASALHVAIRGSVVKASVVA